MSTSTSPARWRGWAGEPRRRRTSDRPTRPSCTRLGGRRAWACVARRHRGLRARGLPPHLARRRRARRRRALPHQLRPSWRRSPWSSCSSTPRCRSRSGRCSTGSAPSGCCSPGVDPDDGRPARVRLRRARSRSGIVARVFVGMGDAMIFISLLRLVALWFPPLPDPDGHPAHRRARPAGRPASRRPRWRCALHDVGLDAVLRHRRRRRVSCSALVARAGRARLAVPGPPAASRSRSAPSPATLRLAWGDPGTRLGLWSHFSAQFGANVFALLWGFPFLVAGQGLSPEHGRRAADADDGDHGGRRPAHRRRSSPGTRSRARRSSSGSSSRS